jgi:rifampicin phosphotransferase
VPDAPFEEVRHAPSGDLGGAPPGRSAAARTLGRYVRDLRDLDAAQVALAGGKGAHLGELSRIDGVRVPAGLCVTTDAYRRIIAHAAAIDHRLERLSRLTADDRAAIGALSADIRHAIEAAVIPDDMATEITAAVARLGAPAAYAVRSSATAEDLPAASFAGQHDSYLNVVGSPAILGHVRRCWASLFTERAVSYRKRHGVDHRRVHMAVVVQQMVDPDASGVLFTADPVTSNRKVASVEATIGLGEALVGGRVDADVYEVRDGAIIHKAVATKPLARRAAPGGGTHEVAVDPARQTQPALTDAQVVRLDRLGRRIEAHFGRPQDIEWCLVDDVFQVVQSRAITTLYPIPRAVDAGNHVYISVGHQQMMTDPMKPLGLSLFQLTALRPMFEAGGRLFVDVTAELASPTRRAPLLAMIGKSDPLIGDALQTIVARDDFLPPPSDVEGGPAPAGRRGGESPPPIDTDPAIVTRLIAANRASVRALADDMRTKSGPALLDFIAADVRELQRVLADPQSHQAIMAGMEATWWLNDHLQAWLGEPNAADALTQSAPYNVTSEMGLALLDVADAIRPHPAVVSFLQHVDGDDGFLDELPAVDGGREARDAIAAYLARYGMRCVGEIDITRPRWSERPTALVPLILGNIRNFDAGAGQRRFELGREEARAKEHDVLRRLRALPDGERKAAETKRMIDRVRTFIGYREYPKYGIISRYAVYKQALLEEAGRLVAARALREPQDVFYLTFEELREVVRTRRVDDRLIAERKEAFRSYQALAPPRVLTSDGEVVTGSYRRAALPPGALVGLPVSAGDVEGRARVVLDMDQADLEPGDILVTAYTDPSWSPVFVAITGLVTEVGGLMTHGAVIAREYGLPAVVGVEGATRLIRDGQRIRVHGTDGFVEILPEPPGGGR